MAQGTRRGSVGTACNSRRVQLVAVGLAAACRTRPLPPPPPPLPSTPCLSHPSCSPEFGNTTGPFLRFQGGTGPGDSSWTGSVLFLTRGGANGDQAGAPQPTLTLTDGSAAGGSGSHQLEPTQLASVLGWAFWRFEIELQLAPWQRPVEYSVSAGWASASGAIGSVWPSLPAVVTALWRVSMSACSRVLHRWPAFHWLLLCCGCAGTTITKTYSFWLPAVGQPMHWGVRVLGPRGAGGACMLVLFWWARTVHASTEAEGCVVCSLRRLWGLLPVLQYTSCNGFSGSIPATAPERQDVSVPASSTRAGYRQTFVLPIVCWCCTWRCLYPCLHAALPTAGDVPVEGHAEAAQRLPAALRGGRRCVWHVVVRQR